MKHRGGAALTAAILIVAQTGEARAQAATPPAAPNSAAPDTTPKKKDGLFGKVKKVAQNKVVQQVAKTAACTMVPGGQAIAGAIDAAGSRSAGEAAAGAATAATGTGCMPDGMAGTGAAGMAAGGVPAGAGGAALAGMAAQAGAAAALSRATSGMTGDDADDESTGGMLGQAQLAACLGLTPEEYQAYADPTSGEPRAPTREEAKRQAKLARKIDVARYQSCLMGPGRTAAEEDQ